MRFASTVRSGSLHVSCLLVLLLAQRLPALADDRPWMGMHIVDCRIESRFLGVAVLRIEEDSPARDAGILAGDIVIELDGLALTGAHDLICRIIVQSPGQRVRLSVLRNGAVLTRVVALGMWPLSIPQTSHSCPVQVSMVVPETSASGG
jgi:S1-C subfamily serine protease